MQIFLFLLLAASCALADKNDNRRNKLPFVADAVGNSLPPPSNVPATVGSPVNLLTPDRYEFYTFDESGELVKRLMTLEEIQAIVAAGEETDGLVTFANDNQPTVSFNINQPPYTKVHSVVTNVQNVLKAQMEAHKNKPLIQPTLDTPDVSDSWSLILPSIFGNTGVDIVLDKSSGTVTTPETETLDDYDEDNKNSLSKEADHHIIGSSTKVEEKVVVTEKVHLKENTKGVSSARPRSTTTTTPKPTTNRLTTTSTSTTPEPTAAAVIVTTPKPSPTPISITTLKATTTSKPTATSKIATTHKPTTAAKFTTAPRTTITAKPFTPTKTITTTKASTSITKSSIASTTKKPLPATSVTKVTTVNEPQNKTTNKQRTTTTTAKPTTLKPAIKTTSKATTTTTTKPEVTTQKKIVSLSTLADKETEKNRIQPNLNAISSTEKSTIEFEKISTYIPISTVKYVTERTTLKLPSTTKSPVTFVSSTKRSVSTTSEEPTTQTTKAEPLLTTDKPITTTSASTLVKDQNVDKINATTITTQSVSPSTTASSTEFLSADKVNLPNNIENRPAVNDNNNEEKFNEPLPLFDVAQSFSQIASDLGSSYQPIPTSSDLLETSKLSELDLESKENLEIDIPSGSANDTNPNVPDILHINDDNFIKISTIDPHADDQHQKSEKNNTKVNTTAHLKDNEKESLDNKKPDTILNAVQKVIITSTQAATETTTIDSILSESIGDLLSQVVNQASSIVNPEKKTEANTKITSTEQSTLPTTKEINKESEIILRDTNKGEKEISSTTIKTLILTTTTTEKIVTEQENITNKNVNHFSKTPPKQQEGLNKPKISVSVKDKESTVNLPNNNNFVQISGSITKENSKIEQVEEADKIKIKNISIINVIKVDKDSLNPKNNENKLLIGHKDQTLSDISTVKSADIPETTTAANKISQSKINKINTIDKTSTMNEKDKLPEPLPKIDEFKKKIQKVNIDDEEVGNQRNNSWKLIPTLSPPKANEIPKDKVKSDNQYISDNEHKDIVLEFSQENQGLEVTTKDLGEDIARFSELSNELAFRYWNVIGDDIDKRRSFVFSPYSTFSMLAMIFMGARGATSGEMNDILKLDDMVTFNPHFTLKNISDSIETSPQSGVAVSAFIRELYSDRNKAKILTFYKERAQHFYNGHVEEINFKLISDIIRRRTNLLVKRYSWGKIPEYMKTNNIVMQPPLAAFTANIFQTDCSGTSVDGRDGEMYFVVSPNVRQRRLVPVPAVVYKKGFLAGYDPVLDVTVAALGNTNTVVSTMFLMPGQQGNVVHVDDLENLEQKLLEAIPTTPTWNRILRTLLPRTGLELQIPRFSHKSTFNTSMTLKKMGLKDLFDGEHADLGGLNGPSKDLYLSDMVQLNTFVTCGEGVVGEQHHIEEYPETLTVSQRRRARWLNDWDEPRDYQRAFHDPHDISDAMHLPLHLRPRQARLPTRSTQAARLKFDRPFLYFVRHNPSGMILYFGRYNPRLLP